MASCCKIFMNIIQRVDKKQFISLKQNPKISECKCTNRCSFSHDIKKHEEKKLNKKIDEYLILRSSHPL